MKQLRFTVIHEETSTFIKLGPEIDRIIRLFLQCLTQEEIVKLKTYIDHNGKYITEDEREHLKFIVNISQRIAQNLGVEVYSSVDLILDKYAFLLLSSRHYHNQKTIYNYRTKLIEVLEELSSIVILKEKNVAQPINTETSQEIHEQINILNDSKMKIEEEAKTFRDLLNQVEKNQNKISSLQEQIRKLNEDLSGATALQKTDIYKKHAELTREINLLNEENESIEYESQGERQKTDSQALKTIVEHYESRLSDMQSELLSHKNPTSYTRNGSLVQLYFSSQYVDQNSHFIIQPIVKKQTVTKYRSFYATLFNILNRGNTIKPSNRIAQNNTNDLALIYQFQMLILSHLRYGYLDDANWKYNVPPTRQSLFKTAFEEITYWVQQLCFLTNVTYQIPNLIMDDVNGYHINFTDTSSNERSFNIKQIPSNNIKTELWITDLITYHIYPSNKKHVSVLNALLNWLFSFSSFRDGQIPIITNYLNGHNTLGILPTGAGKSLTYYFCVLMQPKISLVIAPINSLILDQIEKLQTLHGITRLTNITSSNINMNDDIKSLKRGESLFNFTSPERAQSKQFRDILITLNHSRTVGSIILDEVHCLSEWGHDFRVPYLMLAETLNNYAKGIRYLGLTATASVNVVRDLMIELSIVDKDVISTEHMSRENLEFEIKSFSDAYDAQHDLLLIIKSNFRKGTPIDISNHHNKNAILIFSQTKSSLDTSVEVLHTIMSQELSLLEKGNEDLIGRYTGDFKDDQSDFMHDKKTMMIATKAFGMGIDKPNIRMTVHFGMPASREAFYQEAGRAGRDGKLAMCKLYAIRPSDPLLSRLVKEFLNPNTKQQRMNEIMKYLSKRKVDIATTFYFFLEGYEEPLIESINTIELYNSLNNHQTYRIKFSNVVKKKTEKYLYILFKLGIVKTWEVTYLMNKSELSSYVDIQVEINHRYDDIEHIKIHALKYINAYSSQDETHVIQAERAYVNRIQRVDSLVQLKDLILTMREWYHGLFITTRREQISNMYDMINDFADRGPTTEIQNVIDRFFNITEVIGKTKEGYDLLTFDGVSLSDIIRYAFELGNESLEDRKYEMQVILQSNVNIKNSLYTSLIHLRLNEFVDSHNGDQRFEYALSQLSPNELDEVVSACITNYKNLEYDQKWLMIEHLKKRDAQLIHKLYEEYDSDELINEYAMAYINSKFDESWN